MVTALALPDAPPLALPQQPRRLRRTDADAVYVMDSVEGVRWLFEPIHHRQMVDYFHYKLMPFEWGQVLRDRVPPNTATITGNAPKTFADALITQLEDARLSVRTPRMSQDRQMHHAGLAAEQLFLGLLQQVEFSMDDQVAPTFRANLAFNIALRGFAIIAHTLKKRRGETRLHAEPWDPVHVVWGVGPGAKRSRGFDDDVDGKTLAWACNIHDLNREQVNSRFGAGGDITGLLLPHREVRGQPFFRVYDFYDRELNIVVVDEKVVVKQQHFGQGRVPVTIIPVGASHLVHQNGQAYPEEFGVSAFAHNRDLFSKENAIRSIKYERMLQSINPPFTEKSASGSWRVPSHIVNPFSRGTRIQTSMDDEQEVEAIDMPELPRETQTLEQDLQNQLEAGGFSSVVYGQSPSGSSGYHAAILLAQKKIVIDPRLIALERAYRGMEHHIRLQHSSGFFEPVRLQGEIDRRRPFNVLIEPSVIRQAPAPIIKCRLKNNADIAQRISLAQALLSLGLADKEYVMDEILEIEDVDAMMAAVNAEAAKRALPQLQLFEWAQDLYERGEVIPAQMVTMAMQQYMMMSPGSGELPGQGPASAGGNQPQGRLPRPSTAAGGSPRAGQPNESNESQTMGRPRAAGTR